VMVKQGLAIFMLVAGPILAADSALINLVPADAKVVAGIQVDRATGSRIGQHLLSQLKDDDPDFRKFVTAGGFDPRRDLREVVLASTAGPDKGHGLVLARGVFDASRLVALARTSGATVQKYQGLDVITGPGTEAGWVVFPDSTTAIAGDPQMVRNALDRRRGGAPIDARIAAKVHEFGNRYDIWMVSTVPVSQFAGKMPDKQLSGAMRGDMMQGIEQTSGGILLGSTVEVAGEAVTRSDKDASAMVDVVRFLAGMVQSNRDKQEAAKFASLLDTLELKSEANVMKFHLSIPEADIEKLMVAPKMNTRRAAVRSR
jgi:hypothetical protein